ncbi:MAG: hypothetical protein GY841_07450 [FCB group bacterium]|nr:hypothetical protein [FCB group bacterium]
MKMKSALITFPLTFIVIALLSILSGCGILPEGPDKKVRETKGLFDVRIDYEDGLLGYGVEQDSRVIINITTPYYGELLDNLQLRMAYDPEVVSLNRLFRPPLYSSNYYLTDRRIDTLGNGDIVGVIGMYGRIVEDLTWADDTLNTSNPTILAILEFDITDDSAFECSKNPLRFLWTECDDNIFFNRDDSRTALINRVYDHNEMVLKYEDMPSQEWFGPGNACSKDENTSYIDFINGAIDIACLCCPPPELGNINCNDISNEIADAVMFTNYFVNGTSAFADHVQCSRNNSDVNQDGMTLTVADLVYLVRLIQGNAVPYDFLQPGKPVSLSPRIVNNEMIVDYESESAIGAVWLEFLIDGEITGSLKRADNLDGMEIDDNTIGDTLRVLIFNIGPNAIPAGNGELLRIPVDGSLTLIDADAGDYLGAHMTVIIGPPLIDIPLPDSLLPPNDFPTDIRFTLPERGSWTTIIYNVLGDPIREYSGRGNKGREIIINWDGRDEDNFEHSPGAYFYRVTGEDWMITRSFIWLSKK